MPWDSSNRRDFLPKNWAAIVRRVRQRAGDRCELVTAGARCPFVGVDCHHAGDRTDHREEMLQWLCRSCHDRITQQQAAAARAARQARGRRAPEAHPGRRA